MTKYHKVVYLTLLFSFSFISVFWMMSINNSFCFDDISWMQKVSVQSYEEIFTFFPRSAYLDRPVGIMFLKLLYDSFGLDYSMHHAVLVIVHLLNVLLTFWVVKEIFSRKCESEDECFVGGVIAASFFGIWARTHMAVQWDAAIFDLLGTFFSLLSIVFYLKYRNLSKYKGQNIFLSLLFFYLAIRTKEMFLVLPLLFLLYELWEMTLERKRKPVSAGVIVGGIMFAVFLGMILYCKSQGSITNDASNPYYQSFNPVKLFLNLIKYCMVCFDLENSEFGYVFSTTGLIGTIAVLIGLIFAVWNAFKKKFDFLFCYLAIAFSIVIVLPMVNQVHVLYLYFPTIFVGILFASFLRYIKFPNKAVVLLMCAFLCTVTAEGIEGAKQYWLANASIEKQAWDDIKNIQAPIPDSNIYIINADNLAYTPFFYGDGAVCKLIYNDPTLTVEVIDNAEQVVEYAVPYVILNYKDGRVYEIERNADRELFINEIFHYWQEDESIVLGIVPDKIDNEMMVYIDGNAIQPIIGADFISVQVEKDIIEGKESVVVQIEDKYRTISEDYILNIK